MPTRYKSRQGVRWRGVVKMDGRVVETKLFGTGPSAKRQAAQWELDTRKEWEKRQTETRSVLPSALDWANKYLAYSQQRHAKKTFQEKVAAFKSFMTFSRETDLTSITPAMTMEFLQAQCRVRSGYAANKDRKNLAAAWAWGRKYIDGFPNDVNPFLAIDKFKEERSPRYVPPEEDFWKVVDIATGQDKAMLLALFYLGARRGEIFRLKWEDIDFIKHQVRLGTKKTKGGEMRYDWIPMPQELREVLLQWKAERPYKTEWVFTILDDSPSPYHTPGEPFRERLHFMKRICRRAGVKPFGYHAIRHLHATILFNEGCDLSTTQKQLRHSSPTTTVRYLKSLGYEDAHAQKVLSVIEGRQPKRQTIFQFETRKNPQDKALGDSVHTPGTQSGLFSKV
ncbi:site-specific integrase [Deltaproteobacteria bacterium Smac51]|nr:site-specific integrase [Deltaproteobacteria bacterium Smac51]